MFGKIFIILPWDNTLLLNSVLGINVFSKNNLSKGRPKILKVCAPKMTTITVNNHIQLKFAFVK